MAFGRYRMRYRLAVTTALLLATPVGAHDFWIQPSRFVLPAPDTFTMLIYVGHAAARERWGLSADRVLLFNSIGPDGLIDRRDGLTLPNGRFDAVVKLDRPGSYVLAFQSLPTTSDLPFLRFNDYVAQEGITPIAEHRRQLGTDRSNGRELYSRRAKAIVQVGPVDAAGIARVTRPVGLQLEIVPERHPNALQVGQPLPVRVYYNRRPLAGATVKLNNLDADAKPVAIARTDASGRAMFALPARGQWQFNVVWAEPLTGNPAADYRTIFSSLTFGV